METDSYYVLINDSNHSKKFAELVVVVFKTKEKNYISKNDRAASRLNIQPVSEYFSGHK